MRRLDLAGQKYGHLMVLEPEENAGRYSAWRCRCDCGTETVVRTYSLRSGNTASCGQPGCSCNINWLDLTSHKYGHLTVLAPAENVKGRTAWRCRCDCGRETVARAVTLRSGWAAGHPAVSRAA